jgi:hypothetical protein
MVNGTIGFDLALSQKERLFPDKRQGRPPTLSECQPPESDYPAPERRNEENRDGEPDILPAHVPRGIGRTSTLSVVLLDPG